MTGLDLESFLELLRADVGAWASLGLALVLAGLMAWTSFGSRRALRKCLVLSIAGHVGLVFYGGSLPMVAAVLEGNSPAKPDASQARRVRVAPVVEGGREGAGEGAKRGGLGGAEGSPLDRAPDLPADLAADRLAPPRPEPTRAEIPIPTAPEVRPLEAANVAANLAPTAPEPTAAKAAEPAVPAPAAPATADPVGVSAPLAAAAPVEPTASFMGASLRARPRPVPTGRPADAVVPAPRPSLPIAATTAPGGPDLSFLPGVSGRGPTVREVGAPTAEPARPASGDPGAAAVRAPVKPPAPVEVLPNADLRRMSRPRAEAGVDAALASRTPFDAATALPPARAAPSGTGSLPLIPGTGGGPRSPADVPSVYRSRLDPNRMVLAQRSGATRESEQAVERALDWLARHQDADGRWDGGTARYKDGTVAEGDDDYMVHCPPGDLCYGPCYYWEGDTALTGLALLAFLGSGYTHVDGKYAEVVAKGLDHLRTQQKPDGDLRGRSVAVGMYCHAMASLAMCEAYALTGDPKLRAPVERAVAFLARSRAKDGLAWRYAPGAPVGDTSILGWVVMVFKSAKECGIPLDPNLRQGISAWLSRVSSGPEGGLGKYQPGEKVTPTMTAEAWVCRQFLDLKGPPGRGAEAAGFLLENAPAKGKFNLYYWYYGTLAMFQQGGDSWTAWNAQVRDGIVKRQRANGHASGSWDPDESPYGTHGGRIYCTALAALTLEVYYRYILK